MLASRGTSALGAGFGTQEDNAKVEAAAVRLVITLYKQDGWVVESVERDRCGFDLRCRKGNDSRDVEVKGISGSEVAFTVTHGEVNQARTNPRFVICIVTSVLSERPDVTRYAGRKFLANFLLDPIQYRAHLRRR